MLRPLLKGAGYNIARRTGVFSPRPLNLTFSVSYRCNARCLTCNVWKKRVDDLTLDEYRSVFGGIGRSLYWATFSGGEPFLRPDLAEIVIACYDQCRPAIINIPTNGLLEKRIADGVARISCSAPDAKIIINFSLDGIGQRHDVLRGVPGNYEKTLRTYRRLRAAGHPNVTLGVHTVVSKMNAGELPALRQHVREEWKPDSFITEMAEERLELDTVGLDITPTPHQYAAVVDDLIQDIEASPAHGVARLVQILRREYYETAYRTLVEERQVLPCYAGLASAHIAPNGDVWSCCTRAESMGNLRETNFDFLKVWKSRAAGDMRASIRRGDCACPLANAAYSSMLCEPSSIARAGWAWLTNPGVAATMPDAAAAPERAS